MQSVQVSKKVSSNPAIISFIVITVILIAIICLAFLKNTPVSQSTINNNLSLAAIRDPSMPYITSVDCGAFGTFSLDAQNNSLQLNWSSDTTLSTVWDSTVQFCDRNSISYNRLSTQDFFETLSASNFSISQAFINQYGLPSKSTLMSTEIYTDFATAQSVRFNLTLYCGFFRIETDVTTNQAGVWNNYYGISNTSLNRLLPPLSWPYQSTTSNNILWQIRSPETGADDTNLLVAQFRENGELSLVNPLDPFGTTSLGIANWYASDFSGVSSCTSNIRHPRQRFL
jgi:hypothetical protein